MKKVFCSQYDDICCCQSCHREDEFYKTTYKGIEVNHCCTSITDIKLDIDYHSEDPSEKFNCE